MYIASIAIIGNKEIEYTGTASIIIGSPAFAEAPNEIIASGNFQIKVYSNYLFIHLI
jgi:hypothetical protein